MEGTVWFEWFRIGLNGSVVCRNYRYFDICFLEKISFWCSFNLLASRCAGTLFESIAYF